MIENATKMIAEEIPNLMKLIPAEELNRERDGTTMIVGGVFDHVSRSFFVPVIDFLRKSCLEGLASMKVWTKLVG